jgi:hypothetical protein
MVLPAAGCRFDRTEAARQRQGCSVRWDNANVQDIAPLARPFFPSEKENQMIRKLKSGQYRLYSRKADPRTGKRRNLGTFGSREAAQKHEREVQYFKRH